MAVVKESSVFEPLKFYFHSASKILHMIIAYILFNFYIFISPTEQCKTENIFISKNQEKTAL